MALTPTQALAIDPTYHTLVEAGAGAGKTAVLVARYLAILAHYPSMTPAHILTLTFTKHAAGEFERRIAQALHTMIDTHPEQKGQASEWLLQLPTAQLKTIHSFCHDILKKWGHLIGIDPGFQIMTQEKTHWEQIRDQWLNTHQTHPSLVAWATQAPISDLRHLLTQWAYTHRPTPTTQHRHHALLTHAATLFDRIWTHYQAVCHDTHQMGFNGLQTHALTLVSKPHIAQSIATQYPHLLIDECQDTDPLQWEIIDRITHFSSTPRSCLFVVGDIKQSIYGFRGADPHIFGHIKSLMNRPDTNAKVVTLTDNFRSNHPLIAYFNALFPRLFEPNSAVAHALPITYTPLQSQRGHEGGVYHLHSMQSSEEAQTIAHYLQPIQDKQETVILARSKRILDDIHTALIQAGIPATLAIRSNQLANQDIMDVLHLGLLLENPQNRTWWTYFLRSPWVEGSIEMVSGIVNSPGFPTQFLAENHPIATTIRTWLALKETHGLIAALRQACAQLPSSEHGTDRWVACDQVLEWMAAWPPMTQATQQLEDAFEDGADIPMPVPPNTIRLMTIHAAKGLEFKRVILAGMGRECLGRTPGVRSLITENEVAMRLPGDTDHEAYDQLLEQIKQRQLEEEKRIFYVACTRASEVLILSSHGPIPDETNQIENSKPRYIDMAALIPLPTRLSYPSNPPATTEASHTASTGEPTHPAPPILMKPIASGPGYHRWSVHDVMAWLDSPRESQLGRHVRWDVPDQRNAQVGAAVHYWLFKQCQGQAIPPQWWEDLPDMLRPEIKAHVSRCQEWIPSLQGGDTHHPEWPFQLVLGKAIISGRADLVREIQGEWEVIDFKTGTPNLAQVRHQLMLYALAIRHSTHTTQCSIRATVLSSKTGKRTQWLLNDDELAAFEQRLLQQLNTTHTR